MPCIFSFESLNEERRNKGEKEFACYCGNKLKHKPEESQKRELKICDLLVLDKSLKYDSLSINQLPFEAFEFLKSFIIYFNQKHGNIYYSNATKKISSIQKYDL